MIFRYLSHPKSFPKGRTFITKFCYLPFGKGWGWDIKYFGEINQRNYKLEPKIVVKSGITTHIDGFIEAKEFTSQLL